MTGRRSDAKRQPPHPFPKTENVKKRESDELDEALDESFPASDPPAQTIPPKSDKDLQDEDRGNV